MKTDRQVSWTSKTNSHGIPRSTRRGSASRSIDIGAKIRQAMQRHAEREASHIEVVVRDGTVTLNGKVDSYAEREVARGAAWSAPGVRMVVDNLVVE